MGGKSIGTNKVDEARSPGHFWVKKQKERGHVIETQGVGIFYFPCSSNSFLPSKSSLQPADKDPENVACGYQIPLWHRAMMRK